MLVWWIVSWSDSLLLGCNDSEPVFLIELLLVFGKAAVCDVGVFRLHVIYFQKRGFLKFTAVGKKVNCVGTIQHLFLHQGQFLAVVADSKLQGNSGREEEALGHVKLTQEFQSQLSVKSLFLMHIVTAGQ